MQLIEVVAAGVVLLGTVGIGITAHELSHAVVLQSLGISYDIDWFPTQDEKSSRPLLTPLATVTPERIPADASTFGVRISAIAPLSLTLPFVLVVAGLLPDPLATGNLLVSVLTVGWLGCAIPSPQDFSVFWHAADLVGTERERPLNT